MELLPTAPARADVRAMLDFYSVETLRSLLTSLNKSLRRAGFDYVRDERTNRKEKLVSYLDSAFPSLTLEQLEFELDQLGAAPNATPAPTPAATAAPSNAATNLAAALAAALAEAQQPQAAALDIDQIRAIATEAANIAVLDHVFPVRVELTKPGQAPRILTGIYHKQFPNLLKAIAARQNIWLYGPPGTGKSTGAKQAGAELNLIFRSVGAVDSSHAMLGFLSAAGVAVLTAFRIAWTHGGIFLWDEADDSHRAAFMAINGGLANNEITFPGDDTPTPKHPDCVIIVGANSRGMGGDAGEQRMKMNESSRNRFFFMAWPLDEALEAATAKNTEWLARVRAARRYCASAGITGACITPRDTHQGAALLEQGMDLDLIDAGTWGRSLTDEQIAACARTLPKISTAGLRVAA